ncbi:MAG TPA: ATP-dependent DNA helicase RecG [Candidatus Saccharimonadales bacterium]|nr:ATP-dependent DNA helicase RecG [Candidatus Saccharimonadales bacterium]
MNDRLRETSIEELPLVGPSYGKKLKKLEIETVWDILHHVPTRFLDFSLNSPINNLQIGEIATVKGKIESFRNQYTRTGKTMQILTIADDTGRINATWFNQPFLSRNFIEGTEISLAGKLDWIGRNKTLIAPEYEIIKENVEQIHTGRLIPIYSETAGISSKWLRRRLFDAWKRYKDSLEEFLPKEVLEKYKLLDFGESLDKVHFPKTMEDFTEGKRRLAFNELLFLHLANIKRKRKWQKNKVSAKLKIENDSLEKFIKKLPFELTKSQQKVVNEILIDLEKDIPMNRLLEGDVGSGKTVVAATAMHAATLNGKKSVIMAPTQILAEQHFKTLSNLFSDLKVGLFTGTRKDEGEMDIIVGTHALLTSKVSMEDVALVVVDEQHKFGVEQRNALVKKGKAPHVLAMTATPIPRTVALTFFGDIDLSVLNELPKGRQEIVTWIVPSEKRDSGFDWIHKLIKKEKIQAYVVCPLIDESETETMTDVRAVSKEYEELKKRFKDLNIGILHGRLKAKEKTDVIEKFHNGEIDILVTTPVVEVGVDVANATIMVIEAADRFGLASLHQLRGRVGRGQKKSYCLLLSESDSEKSGIRLTALKTSTSGFELAEIDLAMRGPGEIFGKKQSGFPELKIASWNDIEMIKETKEVAEEMVDKL